MGQVMGTKHAAMAFNQEQYLTNFGELKTLTEQETALAEKYLVHEPGRVQLLRPRRQLTRGLTPTVHTCTSQGKPR